MTLYSSLVSAAQRRKRTTFSLLFLFILLLIVVGHQQVSSRRSFSWSSGQRIDYIASTTSSRNRNLGYSKLVQGVDGSYVFENLYVRDRTLFYIQNPLSPALPELKQIITSKVQDSIIEGKKPYLQRLLLSQDPQLEPVYYDPKSPEFDEEIAGVYASSSTGNDDYPLYPRLRVLTPEEAEEVTPGFVMSGGGAVEQGMTKENKEDLEKEKQEEDLVKSLIAEEFVNDIGKRRPTVNEELEVFEGMTFFLADDPAITGWGSLMHHYFHFLGEVLLGTYHTYQAYAASKEYREGGAPDRFIIPFCESWKNHDLNEVIIGQAFGDAIVVDRKDWKMINDDHKWRMFETVVLTDRHAAHNNPWSQTTIWNKMALDTLSVVIPPTTPPTNFFSTPQQQLFKSLGFPALPERRRGTEKSFTKAKSLKKGLVKVVYVDRQSSDRRFDESSEAGLEGVLDAMEEQGKFGKSTVKVHKVKFEDLKGKEQIKMIYDADVIVGIHGNGLTHIVWTHPGATVLEIFPEGTFIRDYELLSSALNHNYYTIWNDRLVSQKEWEKTPGQSKAEALHDGTRISIDPTFMQALLEEKIEAMI